MPTFETPPDWWVSLSNLVQWLHWPAIAAILTFLALINTARLADRANRDARRREAIYLTGAALILRQVLAGPKTLTPDVTKDQSKSRANTILLAWSKASLVETFVGLDPKSMPTPEAMAALLRGRIAIGYLHDMLERCAKGDIDHTNPVLIDSVGAVEKIAKTLEDEARLYKPREAMVDRVTQSLRFFSAKLRTTWVALGTIIRRH